MSSVKLDQIHGRFGVMEAVLKQFGSENYVRVSLNGGDPVNVPIAWYQCRDLDKLMERGIKKFKIEYDGIGWFYETARITLTGERRGEEEGTPETVVVFRYHHGELSPYSRLIPDDFALFNPDYAGVLSFETIETHISLRENGVSPTYVRRFTNGTLGYREEEYDLATYLKLVGLQPLDIQRIL